MFLDILSIGPDVFFLAQPKDSNFELKSPTNMTLSVVNGLKEFEITISIWTVNGYQSEVSFVRKFEIDCQDFVTGYDIEIVIYS